MMIDPDIALGLVSVGILIDLINAIIVINKWLKGKGPSGIPLVSLMIYASVLILAKEPIFFKHVPYFVGKAIDFILLFGFHILCDLPTFRGIWRELRTWKKQKKK